MSNENNTWQPERLIPRTPSTPVEQLKNLLHDGLESQIGHVLEMGSQIQNALQGIREKWEGAQNLDLTDPASVSALTSLAEAADRLRACTASGGVAISHIDLGEQLRQAISGAIDRVVTEADQREFEQRQREEKAKAEAEAKRLAEEAERLEVERMVAKLTKAGYHISKKEGE